MTDSLLGLLPGEGEAPAGAAAAGIVRPPTESQPTVEPRIIGLDLSLTRTGLAKRSNYAATLPTAPSGDAWNDRDRRLRAIRNFVMTECAQASLVVVEGPSYGSTGGSAFDRAGLWWLTYRGLRHRDIPVAVVSPKSRAKYATGNGNSGKDEVLTAAVRRLPEFDVHDNNAADALWLMAMGYDHYGHPLAEMPATHRAALAAVDWPELLPTAGESQQRERL